MITLTVQEMDPETCENKDVQFSFNESLARRMREWVLLNELNTDSLIMFLTDDEILRLNPGTSESIKTYQELLVNELSEELKISLDGVEVRGEELQKHDTVKVDGCSGILEQISNGKGLVRHFKDERFTLNWFPLEKIKRRKRNSTLFS